MQCFYVKTHVTEVTYLSLPPCHESQLEKERIVNPALPSINACYLCCLGSSCYRGMVFIFVFKVMGAQKMKNNSPFSYMDNSDKVLE